MSEERKTVHYFDPDRPPGQPSIQTIAGTAALCSGRRNDDVTTSVRAVTCKRCMERICRMAVDRHRRGT